MSGPIFSPGFAVTGSEFNENSPLILYDNMVGISNVSADEESADYPVTNLGNPTTFLEWRGETAAEQLITISNAADRYADAIGIARHNFGSAQIQISVEGNTGLGWSEIVAPLMLRSDGPRVLTFARDVYTGIRLRLQAGTEAPRLAVLYAGELLKLPRRIYVGHTPVTLGRQRKVVTGRSESGNFMGRVVTGGQTSTGVSLQNLMPEWYRRRFDPFVLAAETLPFFFSWRPDRYPLEVGYVWLTADPMPKNQRSNGMMQVELQITGIIE